LNIVHEILKMVDHSLLSPSLTDEQLKEGCAVAAQYHTASVCVKPYHVRHAVIGYGTIGRQAVYLPIVVETLLGERDHDRHRFMGSRA